MASTAISSQGTLLKVDISATLTNVANVVSFSGFDGESAEIDVTNLSSTAKEFRIGLQDFGNVQVECHPDFTDAGQDQVRALMASGAVGIFQLLFPNGDKIDFNALVKANPMSAGVDAVLDGSFALRLTGAITITEAP